MEFFAPLQEKVKREKFDYSPNYIDKKGVDSEIRSFEKLDDWGFFLLPRGVQFPLLY